MSNNPNSDSSKSGSFSHSAFDSTPAIIPAKPRQIPKLDSHNNLIVSDSDWGPEKNKLEDAFGTGAASLPQNLPKTQARKEQTKLPMVVKPKVSYLPAGFSDSDSDGEGFEFSVSPSIRKDDAKPMQKLPPSNVSEVTTTLKNTWKKKMQNLPSIPYVNEELAHGYCCQLNTSWNGMVNAERDTLIANHLRNAFKNSVNPYSMGLYLGLHSCDFHLSKNNGLTFTVLKELKQWLTEHGIDELERKFLSPPLQSVAFKVITTQNNSALLRQVATVFRLDLIREQLVSQIKDLASEGNFRDACISATILRLYKSFTIHDFLIPLIFQERMSIVEEFMIGSEDIQKSVLSYLDDLLLKENMSLYLRNYVAERNISPVNKTRFETRAMAKLIQKLSEKFKVTQNTCPNSSRRKKTGSLRHLLSRRYGEASFMHDTDFEDLIDEITADDVTLQEETVFLLRIYGDLTAAAKFAMRKTMQFKNIPDDVKQEMRRLNPMVCPTESEIKAVSYEEEDWDDVSVLSLSPKPASSGVQSPKAQKNSNINPKTAPRDEGKPQILTKQEKEEESPTGPNRVLKRSRASQKFYAINLPLNRIHIVDNAERVNLFLKHLSTGQANIEKSAKRELFTVGFDAEWKPMNPGVEGVALIQVATSDDVFLIDCVKLKEVDTAARVTIWRSLMKEFFSNVKIKKLGYGISQDYKQLAATTSYWKNMSTSFKNTVDLQVLSKELQGLSPKFFPHQTEAPSEFKGLAELVRLCTGMGLDKSEQWSNWEKRPLRDTQIIYAATDAVCLLDIFDFMKVRSLELSVDFNKLVQNHIKGSVSSSLKKGRKRSAVEFVKNVTNIALQNSSSPFKSVQHVSGVKIIVDSMLTALGKQLRACGIDTLILDDKESHTKCAAYALRDDRYIVTQGPVFEQLTTYVPSGHCFQVESESIMSQLRDVLVHFNISVMDTDIFTRCQRCNCTTFINVKASNMRHIVFQSNARLDVENPDTGVIGGLQKWSGSLHEDMIPSTLTQEKKSQKAWQLLPETELRHPDPSVVKTKSGATMELHRVPISLLDSIDDFYICNDCGKCYWEGIHLERILTVSLEDANSSGSMDN